MNPQDVAGYLAAAIVTLVLAFRLARQRLATPTATPAAPVTIIGVTELLEKVRVLELGARESAERIDHLEERLDRRDRRVAALEQTIDNQQEDLDAKDRLIEGLKQTVLEQGVTIAELRARVS